MVDRDAGDAGGALGVGDVVRQALVVELLEGEGDRDEPTVELGDGDLGRDVERAHAVVGLLPVGAAPGEAQALEDRDVEGGELCHVPGLVVLAGAGGGGLGAAGREDRRDERVEGAEVLEQTVGGVAQRGGVDDDALAAGRVDRVGERMRVVGVAGGVLGPVDEDADAGPAGVAAGGVEGGRLVALEDTPLGQRLRRLEALTGEQERVAEEGVQLREVGRAPFGEVAVGLRRGAGRHRRQLHERRVGLLCAAEDDERCAGAAQVGEALPQPLRRAEVADDDDVDAGDALGDLLVGEAGRVADDIVDAGAARAQQVGVGGGQQGDGGHV